MKHIDYDNIKKERKRIQNKKYCQAKRQKTGETCSEQSLSNTIPTLPSHMCVHFVKENAFQVVADRKGTFRNQGFANCLNPETNQWRIGEIIQRGKDLQNFKEMFCERKIRNYSSKGTENMCVNFGNAHKSNLEYIPSEDESEAVEVLNDNGKESKKGKF